MLKNRRGLRSSQSSSGVQPPSAVSVSRRLGAVTTLGTLMDSPVPTLMQPTLPLWVIIPVRAEWTVVLGLMGSVGLVGDERVSHGPPRRAMMRCCSLALQRGFGSVLCGGSRGDVAGWAVGRVGASDWRLKRDWRRDLRWFFGGVVGDVVGVVCGDLVSEYGESGEKAGVFSGSWICMVGTLVSIVRPMVGLFFAVVSLSESTIVFEADVGRESCISTSSSCCEEEYDPKPWAPLGMW